MNKTILIIAVVVLVILGIYILLITKNKDNFDITTDPLRGPAYAYSDIGEECDPERVKGHGLIMSDTGMTVDQFATKYRDQLQTTKADLITRLYCSDMYSNHNQYFSERWESIGKCEQDNLQTLKEVVAFGPRKKVTFADLPHDMQLKIEREERLLEQQMAPYNIEMEQHNIEMAQEDTHKAW